MYILECWIEHPVRQLDQTFTYFSHDPAEPGVRVRINFNGRMITGFVESCTYTEETADEAEKRLGMKIREIDEIIDQQSLITDELQELARWMSRNTLSAMISCYGAMLPGKVKPMSNRQNTVKEIYVEVSPEEVSLTPKQLEAYRYVAEQGRIRYADLRRRYPNQAKALVDKGALISTEEERRGKDPVITDRDEAPPLTAEQQKAVDEIRGSNDQIYLLHGVTGSGKTEIYLQLAEEVLKQGRQVLILVPEIALTPQMIHRAGSRFGSHLAVYHSGLNDQQKYEQYRRVAEREAEIVVGTRSAVFLPFHDLGLIVMDEEHDSSYKQENQPAYHCRDIAVFRSRYHHCRLILGSATPSLDSYARAIRGVYHLITLKDRVNHTLPEVTVIPLKECMKKGQSYILSDPLLAKIQERLDRKQQVILLLNRRGYSTMLRCQNCQEPLVCPHCDITMSYHREEKVLKCHTCGTILPVPRVCPSCGKQAGYSGYGFGTQRLEQMLSEHFPEARLLRMDADTTSRKNGHQQILEKFGRHEADILFGTQMIAKGLDYPDVTLVGILNGDEGLNRTDYRSCEDTFDLLMQAGGRSGRAEEAGEVVYQVYDPGHYAVQCAAAGNYGKFFEAEMRFRHAGQYPPYTYMIALTFADKDEKIVSRSARWFFEHLEGDFKKIGIIALTKIQDRYRSRIVIKGKDSEALKEAVRRLITPENAKYTGCLRVDVDPLVLD